LSGARRVVVAEVGAPHGVRGEVRVKPFTETPEALRRYGPLLAEDGRAFRIERLRPDKALAIVKFEGVDDRDRAAALTGLRLSVPREALPEPQDEDEFYHADLIGLAAATPEGETLGRVVAIHDFGAGDILEIRPERGAALLLPFTRAVVPEIDLARGRLTIVMPEETEARGEGEAEDGAS